MNAGAFLFAQNNSVDQWLGSKPQSDGALLRAPCRILSAPTAEIPSAAINPYTVFTP
ncbi:MAG: hypothetical protein R3C55_17630 [Parvularculaceae bacterium]